MEIWNPNKLIDNIPNANLWNFPFKMAEMICIVLNQIWPWSIKSDVDFEHIASDLPNPIQILKKKFFPKWPELIYANWH